MPLRGINLPYLASEMEFCTFMRVTMLARDEVEAYMFGRMDERLAVLELLSQYLEDPRSVKEVLKEIIERISERGT